MKHEAFMEVMESIENLFSNKDNRKSKIEFKEKNLINIDIILNLLGKLLDVYFDFAFEGNKNKNKVKAGYRISRLILAPFSKINPQNEIYEEINSLIESGLQTLRFEVKNTDVPEQKIKESIADFKKARNKCFEYLNKHSNISTNIFTIINPYRKIKSICTKGFIASILETYCYKLLKQKKDINFCFENAELFFYLRIFYLENQININNLKNSENKTVTYVIKKGSTQCFSDSEKHALSIYENMQKEEAKFFKISKQISNKFLRKTFDNNYKLEYDSDYLTSTDTDIFITYVSFSWNPSIFNNQDCWNRI
ncbi:hypothetical protein Riv7116_4500 [Rivularia sp. PCC 7116]|uniref:hypothetical protein n=1 Tax=Rivularia sp. PCC 7116 TaxID=373994 RepID=UPI00029F468C|nr:hypothetical protein [Rivularia sp. PCC 7116]AFY56921.1 hypothetical protein Riv7116_4500 [Rivularia sp. PCC 7116]